MLSIVCWRNLVRSSSVKTDENKRSSSSSNVASRLRLKLRMLTVDPVAPEMTEILLPNLSSSISNCSALYCSVPSFIMLAVRLAKPYLSGLSNKCPPSKLMRIVTAGISVLRAPMMSMPLSKVVSQYFGIMTSGLGPATGLIDRSKKETTTRSSKLSLALSMRLNWSGIMKLSACAWPSGSSPGTMLWITAALPFMYVL